MVDATVVVTVVTVAMVAEWTGWGLHLVARRQATLGAA